MSNQYLDIALQQITNHEVNEVLEKIKAEINQLSMTKPCYPYLNEFAEIVNHGDKSAKDIKKDVLDIIDKYKAGDKE